jgi:nucleoside-diphosphate-sugar epimerase
MSDALIGSSGFVGSSLARQHAFDAQYRSTNIEDIRGREFDIVACAGAPGRKWLANRDPQSDRNSIARLCDSLALLRCRRFVLLSTADVFAAPIGVDEDSSVETRDLAPYGLHRYELENSVREMFGDNATIVRLPGLVGPALRKNLLYDLQNNNDIEKFDARSRFQFYPVVNLWPDICVALEVGLPLIHLTAAPVTVADVAAAGFDRIFETIHHVEPVEYDMRTKHASHYGVDGMYQYARRESLLAVRAYHQSANVG